MIIKSLRALRAGGVAHGLGTVDAESIVHAFAIHFHELLNEEGLHKMALAIEAHQMALHSEKTSQ